VSAALGYARRVLVRHRGHVPSVDPSAYIAPSAELIGRVTIGARARVMSGAVLDAEGSRIDVGECAIVCEHAVLRATAVGDDDHPVIVGDHAFVSPHATLLGCRVEAASYIATGATVLHGAHVRSGAVVAVAALVHAGTVLPSAFFLAPGTIAIGDPVASYAPGDPSLPDAIRGAGFAARAFGVSTAWEDRIARYREIAEVRSEEFGAHVDDEPVSMIDPQDSTALVRRLVEIVNAGSLDGLEEVASGEIAEAARRWIGPFRESFPDFRMEVREVIAEGDKVVGYFKCSGTHRGHWRGNPPTGKRFEDVDEVYVFRVEQGKLASAIAVVEDNLTRMRQLGIQP
jgi:carbonic anhydrase/acetyltransferase-like protein (isoleucine patch superfamily)/predicted ester cyclase